MATRGLCTTLVSFLVIIGLTAGAVGQEAGEPSAKAPASGLTLNAEGEATILGLDGGAPFHRTTQQVINERLIDVAGSTVRVALWSEVLPDGLTVPFYAISLDGQTVATVRQTSYELKLRHGEFDPGVGVLPVQASLAADETTGLYIVQFVTQPLEAYRSTVRDLGGTVYQFLAQHAHIVKMTPEVRESVAALPFVRWIGAFHPAYRLEEFLLDNQAQSAELYPLLPYNIMVFEAGMGQKRTVANRISALGGIVELLDAGKYLLEATLTPEQLFEVASWDEVLFIDRWGALEEDMNNARIAGGANHIETVAGYTGTGVRGESFDSGFNLNHVDFASRPLIVHGTAGSASHGASTSGICFGDGTGDPNARGLLPSGQGIVANYNTPGLTGPARYIHTGELLQAPYYAVFQTSSVGSPRTANYTTISVDTDASLFDFDIVHCQSQSNAGNTQSRPQAWAKNIISGGGVRHYDTLATTDDCWCSGGSTGPATDGRIKPDLCAYYDDIRTVTGGGSTAYTNTFGGTSGATPIICGHVGLFFEMWADEAFGNVVPFPPGTGPSGFDVFDNKAHMTTAKAAMINSANQYPFTGTGHDLTRVHQGWGWPDIGHLYDMRDNLSIINEDEVLQNLESIQYFPFVQAGEPALKVTLVYADPPGNPASNQHRINDLTLKVTSPSNVVYWGNNGLLSGNWSTPGGSANVVDTVENVFVQNPESGVWVVDVIASEVVQDSHVETPQLDADFALVISGAPPGPRPPRALNMDVSTAVSTPATFTLQATDDGFPDPPAAMTYIVASLPTQGTLSEPGVGPITTVPHTLAGGASQVDYDPTPGYNSTDSFEFKANDGGVPPEGGDSALALVSIMVGGPEWDPAAIDGSATTPQGTPVDVVLTAIDPNGDPLTYVIESLPATGSLTEPGVGPITSVPHTLAALGSTVSYDPPPGQALTDPFTFSAWDATAGSNIATMTVTVGGAQWDPVANSIQWGTGISLPTDITLSASDPNNDPLTYVIEILPTSGSLTDPGNGPIGAVPYTLVGGSNVVTYHPPYGQALQVTFGFSAQDATASSNIATVTVDIGAPHAVFNFLLDTDPGWTTEGQWAFGQPTGGGSEAGDPTSGATGNFVYGFNLNGDYTNFMPVYYLTTSALDCTHVQTAELRFNRWLGVEGNFDDASVELSTDGTTWTLLWEHGNSTLDESSWSFQSYDISALADGEPTVFIRWGMGPTDSSNVFAGWNLDDVQIWGLDTTPVPPPCGTLSFVPGDVNVDLVADGLDIKAMVDMLLNPAGGWTAQQICAADFNDNGVADPADIALFVQELLN